MIKGLEALTAECLCAASQYSVENEVLASLHASFPSLGWDSQLPHYLISRIAEHGKRRAEEMRESARTVQEAGFEPIMTRAIADKQQWVADQARAGVFKELPAGAAWQAFADALIAARKG